MPGLQLHEVEAPEGEAGVVEGANLVVGRVLHQGQDVRPVVPGDPAQNVVEVVEQGDLEVLLDVVPPVLGGQLPEDGRAEHQVQRDDLPKLRQARPLDELPPRFAAGRVESLDRGVDHRHGRSSFVPSPGTPRRTPKGGVAQGRPQATRPHRGRGRQAISQRWGHLHRQTPAFGLRTRQMHGPAARTRRLPVRRLLGGRRHGGPAGRVAHVLERQRRAGLALAAVAAQAPRPPVEVDGLLAGRAGRLPVAGLHDGLARGLAGPGRGPQPDGDGLPRRAVPGGGAGEGVGDLVPERVEDRLLGAVPGVVLGDLDPLLPGTCRRPAAAWSSPGRRSSRAGRASSTPGGRSPPSSSRSIPRPPWPAIRLEAIRSKPLACGERRRRGRRSAQVVGT